MANTQLRDQLFGTRGYTEGARYQLPRKIPLRIEPKTYFGEYKSLNDEWGLGKPVLRWAELWVSQLRIGVWEG